MRKRNKYEKWKRDKRRLKYFGAACCPFPVCGSHYYLKPLIYNYIPCIKRKMKIFTWLIRNWVLLFLRLREHSRLRKALNKAGEVNGS